MFIRFFKDLSCILNLSCIFNFKSGKWEPYFNVLSLWKKFSINLSCFLKLINRNFKVNIWLPNTFRIVKISLNCLLINVSNSFKLLHIPLELSKGSPCLTRLRKALDPFLVQNSTIFKTSNLELQIDVKHKNFFASTFSYWQTQQFSNFGYFSLPYQKVCILNPNLWKCELMMRYYA